MIPLTPVGFFDGQVHTRTEGGRAFGPDQYLTYDDSSPFGIKDLAHNVLEIMKDGPSDYGAEDEWLPESINPAPAANCEGIAVRNTSWRYSDIVHTGVTSRHFICLDEDNLPECVNFDRDVIRVNDIGLRCAFDL